MSLTPKVCSALISERATRECLISPTIATDNSSNGRGASRWIVSISSIPCVGCACQPSPPLIMAISGVTSVAMKWAAPDAECRTTKISAVMACRFHSVSRKLSPFLVLERSISILSTLAPRRFSATSKVVRVRVDGSKNKFITV